MKSAVTYLYKTSKEAVKERDERKEWRKTYDPDYLPRRSMLANKFENRKSRVMSMFGRPNSMYRTRDSVATVSTVSDRGSMMRDPGRDSVVGEGRERYEVVKEPESAYVRSRMSTTLGEVKE